MIRLALAIAAAALTWAVAPAPVEASSWVIVRAPQDPSFKVDRHGRATVSYTRYGKRHHVIVWGAINANPAPTGPDSPQQRFRLDYSGGWGSFGAGYWRRARNVCGPYTGPPLRWLVSACTAPDGSHWALQLWRRLQPNVGRPPREWYHRVPELHLAHWKGPLPTLTVQTDWLGPRHLDHLSGQLTWRGRGMYGWRATSQGNPTDRFGTLVYMDTLNSELGRGWKRFNSFLTHNPRGSGYTGGTFCQALWPRLFGSTRDGKGERYRLTVSPPGVFPLLVWEGPAPGPFDAGLDAIRDAAQRAANPPFDPCHDPTRA